MDAKLRRDPTHADAECDQDPRDEGATQDRTRRPVVVPVESFSVLPGHERMVEIPLEADLAPGRYLAIPVLEYGDDGLMGAQVAFRVR